MSLASRGASCCDKLAVGFATFACDRPQIFSLGSRKLSGPGEQLEILPAELVGRQLPFRRLLSWSLFLRPSAVSQLLKSSMQSPLSWYWYAAAEAHLCDIIAFLATYATFKPAAQHPARLGSCLQVIDAHQSGHISLGIHETVTKASAQLHKVRQSPAQFQPSCRPDSLGR